MRILSFLPGTQGSVSASVVAGILLGSIGLALFLAGAYRGLAIVRAAGLMLVLLGYFVVFTVVLWSLDPVSPLLSTALLLGSVAVFRLMTAFEQPPRNPSAPS